MRIRPRMLMDADEGGGSGGEGEGTPAPSSITVGDNNYSVEQVAELLSNNEGLTQQVQGFASIKVAADQFGMDPETYANQSSGALAVIGDLMEKGIIDDQGRPTGQAAPPPPPPATPAAQNPNLSVVPPSGLDSGQKTIDIIAKALAPLQARVEQLGKENISLLRLSVQEKLQKENEGLTEEDVSRVFGLAANDKSKTVQEHAAAFLSTKSANEAVMRKKFASEFLPKGMTLDEFDENQLDEQGSGGAAGFFKGKKFSFGKGPRKKGEDEVTPLSAMQDFMRKKNRA